MRRRQTAKTLASTPAGGWRGGASPSPRSLSRPGGRETPGSLRASRVGNHARNVAKDLAIDVFEEVGIEPPGIARENPENFRRQAAKDARSRLMALCLRHGWHFSAACTQPSGVILPKRKDCGKQPALRSLRLRQTPAPIVLLAVISRFETDFRDLGRSRGRGKAEVPFCFRETNKLRVHFGSLAQRSGASSIPPMIIACSTPSFRRR